TRPDFRKFGCEIVVPVDLTGPVCWKVRFAHLVKRSCELCSRLSLPASILFRRARSIITKALKHRPVAGFQTRRSLLRQGSGKPGIDVATIAARFSPSDTRKNILLSALPIQAVAILCLLVCYDTSLRRLCIGL